MEALVPDPEHYCLSIINEYQIDTINGGIPFIWARTFYDLSRDIHILRFEHPVMSSFYYQKMVLLDLQNVTDIDFWQHASSATISDWKQNKNAIWAQPNVWPDEDLFVVMKSATDSRYKYVYIPQDKLPDLQKPIKQTDAIYLDWKTLKTDLQRYTIKSPIKSRFRGTIYAVNSRTGKKCVFFEEQHEAVEPRETFDLFIPSQPLQDFQAIMEWYDTYTYEYRIVHGYELTFPYFDKSKFIPSTYEIDSTHILTTMNSFPDYFRILYVSTSPRELPQVGKKMHQSVRSHWIVIGENPSTIDFTLPKISMTSTEKFVTMERWFVEYFENVKVLEENTDIDIVNFYRDYNLLRVVYRDPYKE
jgi:hypothetical protein